MNITLNGKTTTIQNKMTLQELLENLKVQPQMVACELNSKIVRRRDYANAEISEGDIVEILQMIGGG